MLTDLLAEDQFSVSSQIGKALSRFVVADCVAVVEVGRQLSSAAIRQASSLLTPRTYFGRLPILTPHTRMLGLPSDMHAGPAICIGDPYLFHVSTHCTVQSILDQAIGANLERHFYKLVTSRSSHKYLSIPPTRL